MAAADVEHVVVPKVTVNGRHDPKHPYRAVEFYGKKDVRVDPARPRPMVTDPEDAIIRVTSTCICGSDLHIYVGMMPGIHKGDTLGHEFMGIVEDVGPAVKHIRSGDRVVSSFCMGCNRCYYCKHELYSCCDSTAPEDVPEVKEAEKLYGHKLGGFHGYTRLTGGWEGGQADVCRVAFADVNLLKVPDEFTDEQVVFLSDILPTAWHATELGEVKEGDTVAVWGAGPVGQLAAQCAQYKKAAKVWIIDNVDYRLAHARATARPRVYQREGEGRVQLGVETINFDKESPYDVLVGATHGLGPDVGIEAVGFHYVQSKVHTLEIAVKAETDTSEILNEMIRTVRKGGRLGVVGVYAGFCNHLNIGGFMEKGLSMRAGQCPVQKYWHHLLQLIKDKKLDATKVLSHVLPLDQAPHAYKIFNDKEDKCIKVVLKPQTGGGGEAKTKK